MNRVVFVVSCSVAFLAGCSAGTKSILSPLVKPATVADVSVMRARYPRTPVVVFIGDGITQGWITQEQKTHPTWINEAGTDPRSVESSGAMLARFKTDVIALHPDIVHILVGTFDIAGSFVIWPQPCGTGATVAEDPSATPGEVFPEYETCINVQAMSKMAQAAGIKVIIGTLPPWGPEQAIDLNGNTTGNDAFGMQAESAQPDTSTIAEYNSNMLLSKRRNVAPYSYAVIADYYKALNPTWVTAPLSAYDAGDPAANEAATISGVFPNAAGYNIMTLVAQQAITEVSAQR
jgi:hypothetical protein